MRLDKFLANAGVGTRKEVREILKKRKVLVNGNFEKETIDQAIEALKLIIPFKTYQKGNTIIIYQ